MAVAVAVAEEGAFMVDCCLLFSLFSSVVVVIIVIVCVRSVVCCLFVCFPFQFLYE